MSTPVGTSVVAGTYTTPAMTWYNGAPVPGGAWVRRTRCGDFYRKYGKQSGFVGIGLILVPKIGSGFDTAMLVDNTNTVTTPTDWTTHPKSPWPA